MEDVRLSFTDTALRAVAQQAITHGTGARGLRSIMERLLLDLMYDLPGRTDVAEVVITEATVRDGAEPTLVHENTENAAGA
jgi:ATP-dependent Clp protease ATP-binding subunit ClpX